MWIRSIRYVCLDIAKLLLIVILFTTCSDKLLSISELVKKSDPAVVLISSFDKNKNLLGFGSGFIVSAHGIVVTNYHVIKHSENLEIKLADNSVFPVTGVVDYDPEIDFAILKIDATGLPFVLMGDDRAIKKGDAVVAIGNPMGLEHSVTSGIISQRRKEDSVEYLQIDAAINKGNSGGPLFNLYGEVIGVNTLKGLDAEGIGFAIPISYIKTSIRKGVTSTSTITEVLRKQQAKDSEVFAASFKKYDHPENLFSLYVPKDWLSWQKDYWTDSSKTEWDKSVVFAPGGGYNGDKGGTYLAEGVRIRFRYPKEGNNWIKSSAIDWSHDWLSGYLRSNRGFTATDDSSESHLPNGQVTKVYQVIGKNDNISEPEKGIIILTGSSKYRVIVELAAPLSKFPDYQVVFGYITQSFIINEAASHPVYN